MAHVNERPLEGMSVLIAEDSWHLADAIRITIEQAGGIVAGMAGTLAAAQRMASSLAFDAAVMDLNLHGKLANVLIETLADRGIKVVVLTGYERPEQLAARVHECLTKPVSTDVLIAALARPRRA